MGGLGDLILIMKGAPADVFGWVGGGGEQGRGGGRHGDFGILEKQQSAILSHQHKPKRVETLGTKSFCAAGLPTNTMSLKM